MTDDISMEALPGVTAARCEAALSAGCDLVLHCNGEMEDMEAAVAVCPRLAGASLRRAERALARRPAGPELDIAAARAELRGLIA